MLQYQWPFGIIRIFSIRQYLPYALNFPLAPDTIPHSPNPFHLLLPSLWSTAKAIPFDVGAGRIEGLNVNPEFPPPTLAPRPATALKYPHATNARQTCKRGNGPLIQSREAGKENRFTAADFGLHPCRPLAGVFF